MSHEREILFLKEKIEKKLTKKIKVMEVCGTHTMSIAKLGLRSLLPSNFEIISGPGCPVCVTSEEDLQMAIDLAQKENVIVATFGDMLKIPTHNQDSLLNYKNVKICYSPLEAINLSEKHPEKEIVFLGIGFETTAPLIAATILEAKQKNIKNFSVLTMHKTVPDALTMILSDPDTKIDALLLPGHVSAITGTQYWDFLKSQEISGVVVGFDALSLMEAFLLIVDQCMEEKHSIENHYESVVTREGNIFAWNELMKVFEPCTSSWREIGPILNSGLDLKENYKSFCAKKRFNLQGKKIPPRPGCLCGKILMGKNMPLDCPHFAKTCTPISPIGPCMVSSEGTCAAWYKYHR